jgi:hypothetical protein
MATQPQEHDTISPQERLALTRAIMYMLDCWGLSAEDIIRILALPPTTRTRQLARFRADTPFPEEAAVMTRIEHLVGIADALRTTYPRNANMGPLWLRTPHRRFQRRTPLATMVEGGLNGLISVRAELDCAYAWERSEPAAPQG